MIELKKKSDDEKENQYVINQLLNRAAKLAAYCPNIQRIWYYTVIEINETMVTRLRQQKWDTIVRRDRFITKSFRPNDRTKPSFLLQCSSCLSTQSSRTLTAAVTLSSKFFGTV